MFPSLYYRLNAIHELIGAAIRPSIGAAPYGDLEKRRQAMRSFSSWAMILSASVGLSFGQGDSDATLHKVGEGKAHASQHPNNGQGPIHSHDLLLPDSVQFEQEKLRAQGGGTSGVPKATTGGTAEGLLVNTGSIGLALSDTPGYIPPDTQIAAGLNGGVLTTVEMVNGTILVTDSVGPHYLDMCGFFFCDLFTAVISDPIVRFDPPSGRWFASVVTIEYVAQGVFLVPEGQWRLAVSSTSDPLGNWTVYAATMSNGTFPDFPKLGISSDKVVQTGDAFTVSSNKFKGTEFGVLNKQDLLNGVQTPGFQYFGPNQGAFAIESVQSSTSTLYMAAVNTSTTIRVWKLNGVPNTSGTGVTMTASNVTVAPFITPPNAPQLGSSELIDTNGDYLVGGAYDDANHMLWVSAASGCVPIGDTATRSCLRLVEINLGGATPALAQDITFGVSGEYFYYPAVAFDQKGNFIAVFNRSSGAEYVGVYAGGQLASAPGTFQSPVVVKAGETAYTITPPRWGDYSGASTDPTLNSPNVWLAGEYSQAVTGVNQWGTWMTTASFP